MVEPKKLIVFIPSIEDGGVEKNLYIILNYLSKKIDDITLITYDDSKKTKFSKKIKILNPFFNSINFKGRYPKYFFCLTVLIKILLFRKNNLVLSFQANIFAIITSIFFKTPIISRSNSSSAGWSNNKIKQKIFKFYFKKANKIIVNSYEFKKEMDNKYKIDSECILNPFQFSKIKKLSNENSEKIFKQKKILKLISVGRLTDQKDFKTMIKGIKYVKRNVQLIIIGKGANDVSLKNYINELKLSHKVNLIGYKKNPFKYMKQADIFLLTSKFEGSPNVLVEAQYLKKYIISTNCPTGPREILNNGKYGKLIKIGDYKELSKIIENYSLNKTVKHQLIKGYKNSKNYSYMKNCELYYKLIRRYL